MCPDETDEFDRRVLHKLVSMPAQEHTVIKAKTGRIKYQETMKI